jgi:P4 family phage/plasmid primase-like protien
MDYIQKYKKHNLVICSVDIKHEMDESSGEFKKDITFPKQWQKSTLKKKCINKYWNSFVLLTGKINNIIVVDIDNIEHWKQLLKKHNQIEPDTVKATSGNGGIHLYFKYCEDFDFIKTNTKSFDSDFDIDVRTDGGCIIVPPSKYFNKKYNKEVEYIWNKNIFDNEIAVIPNWMIKLLLEHRLEKETIKIIKKNQSNIDCALDYNTNSQNINKEDSEINFTIDDIEYIIDMLSEDRCNNYSDWINIGMCLFNINKNYLVIWNKWSKKSEKYENGICENKWKTFKKNNNGFQIGSLLMWAKYDNPKKYDAFIKKRKINNLINSKYPNEKLILGETIVVNNKCRYTHLKNKQCLIKGAEHMDMPNSMYVEMIEKFVSLKCRHLECFGKTHPCEHILMNKNEMNIVFNGNVNITINGVKNNDELIEFQKINIYDDEKINELVYEGLDGEASSFAEIIYYFYKNKFNYGEDENWYIYENHKWKNIGKKNIKLRYFIQSTIKETYSKLIDYYVKNDYNEQKIKAIKEIIYKSKNTITKNNIMTELIDMYSERNNPNRDFVKKLDLHNYSQYLIGFDNGVYDLQKFEFRDGKFDDYITMTVGYNYSDKHTDKYNDLIKFLEDIQPNKEERDYMLFYLSIALVGNILELFTILSGVGRNGKSKLIELTKLTFGDYFASVQSQMFTRPRPDASSPDPGLLHLLKKKIVIASEPEKKNSQLNSGFIKFITGRDSTTLRNCHSNDMIDFTAKFITLLICNDIPECDEIDAALCKRLRCIHFPTEFVAEPKKQNQKKINVNINENFDHWKLDFILLLIEYYKKYKETNELKTTKNILKWTDQYKEDTNLYLQFLNENTEENKDGHIHCSILYATFKEWFRTNNPNTKIPSNKEFVNNIRKCKEVIKINIDGLTQLGIRNLKLINEL